MTEEEYVEAEYPDAWVPAPGDEIAGRVVGITMSPDFGYGPYPIVTLDVEGTERAVHAMHQVLRQELAKRAPRIGDEVQIKFLGKRKPKTGNGQPFNVYRVTGGQEREFSWDSQLPEDEREQLSQSVPIQAAPTPSQVARAADAVSQEPAGAEYGEEPPFAWRPVDWLKSTEHNPFA